MIRTPGDLYTDVCCEQTFAGERGCFVEFYKASDLLRKSDQVIEMQRIQGDLAKFKDLRIRAIGNATLDEYI